MGTGTWGMRDKFIYHVMIRGINRQDIFEAPEDYRKFIETLASLREVVSDDMQTKICPCHIYAYCIMPNHVHILIHVTEGRFFCYVWQSTKILQIFQMFQMFQMS